jgi:undecaprenyl diphosphate synthase
MNDLNHIAIIMDGNGRWGIKNYKSRLIGHKFGVQNIKNIIEYCIKINLKNLSLYALSFDNLKNRNSEEINNLFKLFEEYFEKKKNFFIENKIKINFIGEKKNLPKYVLFLIENIKKKTNFRKSILNINIAFNYSSKKEIVSSVIKNIKLKKKINEENLNKFLYTSKFKDPEILIRTGSYKRLSDFMLWQCSYTELFFSNKLWPDFKSKDLEKCIKKYHLIHRNFGK